MTTPESLSSLIRFSLSELSGRNGHHEFEELVRHLVRARIATNVIPATGPVGAGGDQGRDLETFRTYLSKELGPNGAFLARASNETLAMVCTLQKKGIRHKINADIDKIMAAGSSVQRVYAFITEELPVGARHQMQEEAKAKHGIELELFDSRAIAQELSVSDTFWIAERYLSLPAEIAPLPQEGDYPDWYGQLLTTWRGQDPSNTVANFLAIKKGLRRATFYAEARADLPFWLALMRRFLETHFQQDLQHKAKYEICVATLRGTGDLRPVDGLAAEFIEQSCESEESFALEDGSVLLTYCAGAHMRGKTGLLGSQLSAWNEKLRVHIKDLLGKTSNPNRKAILLQILGALGIQPNSNRVAVLDQAIPDVANLINGEDELDLNSLAYKGMIAREDLTDLEEAISTWANLAGLLENASLFPIERFADYISIVTPMIADHALYRTIVDAVDAQVEKTAGRSSAAGRSRDRAISLCRSEMFVAALREFHQAKVGWWSGDSMRGSLLSMLLIADCYEQIGFLYAAKHWALLAARIADDSGDDDLKDLLAKGVTVAAHMDYGLGNWTTSAATTEVGLLLHSHFVASIDVDDPQVERTMHELAWIYLAGRDLLPQLAGKVHDLLERAGMWEIVSGAMESVDRRSEEEWLSLVGPQLYGEWMGDLKGEVRITFSGLGTIWTIISGNDAATIRAAQRLASAAQILLAELSREDLALLKTRINIHVAVDRVTDSRARAMPSNKGRDWQVSLSPWAPDGEVASEELHQELLVILSNILSEASLLPMADFMRIIHASFKRGLSDKIGFGLPFDELLRWIASEDYLELCKELSLPRAITEAQHKPNSAPELEWRSGIGPTYSHTVAVNAISRRYERVLELFPCTLARLKASATFQDTARALRLRGWRDWHILSSIVNVAVNFRMQKGGLDRFMMDPGPRGDEARAKFQLNASEPETDESIPIPMSSFSKENLEFNRVLGLPLLLKGFGLELRQRTPDVPAIDEFLRVRYRIWDDDVAHDDPFAC